MPGTEKAYVAAARYLPTPMPVPCSLTCNAMRACCVKSRTDLVRVGGRLGHGQAAQGGQVRPDTAKSNASIRLCATVHFVPDVWCYWHTRVRCVLQLY
eukprot:1807814-Rhodomonas_salina.3